LTVAVPAGGATNTITLASVVGFAEDEFIHIDTTSVEPTHPQIVDITGNVLTLDRYLDEAHEIGDAVERAEMDMADVVGSITTPIEYYIGPPDGEVWHINRILFEMTHSTAGDLGLFGNLAALTNGVIMRVRRNGQYRTLTNWKANADLKSDMFDVDFDTRSSGGGTFGTSGRWTFDRLGATVELTGGTNDRIEVYIQDDITGLLTFTMKGQGHLEEA
jgi:hypothetical protein